MFNFPFEWVHVGVPPASGHSDRGCMHCYVSFVCGKLVVWMLFFVLFPGTASVFIWTKWTLCCRTLVIRAHGIHRPCTSLSSWIFVLCWVCKPQSRKKTKNLTVCFFTSCDHCLLQAPSHQVLSGQLSSLAVFRRFQSTWFQSFRNEQKSQNVGTFEYGIDVLQLFEWNRHHVCGQHSIRRVLLDTFYRSRRRFRQWFNSLFHSSKFFDAKLFV